MAKNKWRAREYTPSGNMTGSHSFYGEAVIDNDIDNRELAAKIAARTGFKSYEVQAVVAAIADIVLEEVMESNRISLSDEQGTKMVSIYPKVTGSVSDEQILKETTSPSPSEGGGTTGGGGSTDPTPDPDGGSDSDE